MKTASEWREIMKREPMDRLDHVGVDSKGDAIGDVDKLSDAWIARIQADTVEACAVKCETKAREWHEQDGYADAVRELKPAVVE